MSLTGDRAERLVLAGVGDLKPEPLATAEECHYEFGHVVDGDCDFPHACIPELFEDDAEYWPFPHRNERLGNCGCVRLQASAFATCKNDCFHNLIGPNLQPLEAAFIHRL